MTVEFDAASYTATEDCSDDGAICTGDGRMLSNELVPTVSGPGQWRATKKARMHV